MRLHESLPPHSLALAFATPLRTLDDHFDKMLRLFNQFVVPRLFFFEHHDDVRARISPDSLKHHPNVLLAGDATLFEQLTPSNFLLNKLLYNSYHSAHGFHVVIGKHCTYAERFRLLTVFLKWPRGIASSKGAPVPTVGGLTRSAGSLQTAA